MNKIKQVFFAVLALAIIALPTFAQGGATESGTSLGTGLGVIGFGLAAGLAGIGQGLVGSRAAEGAARNPGATSNIQTLMIIALALIESLVLFALLIVFLKIK